MINIQEGQSVMMIEDNDDDYEATLRALKFSGFSMRNKIIRFDNGDSALEYLRREGEYADINKSPRPGIILLDLNMPGISGREVLSEIKSSEILADIPVIILTTSDNEIDVKECYSSGANTYIKKPVNIDNFFEAIKKLTEYWFELALLPKENNEKDANTKNIFKF
jgi:two-component system response regulator